MRRHFACSRAHLKTVHVPEYAFCENANRHLTPYPVVTYRYFAKFDTDHDESCVLVLYSE